MRDTPSPSWRASDSPPATLRAGGAGGITATGFGATTGAAATAGIASVGSDRLPTGSVESDATRRDPSAGGAASKSSFIEVTGATGAIAATGFSRRQSMTSRYGL